MPLGTLPGEGVRVLARAGGVIPAHLRAIKPHDGWDGQYDFVSLLAFSPRYYMGVSFLSFLTEPLLDSFGILLESVAFNGRAISPAQIYSKYPTPPFTSHPHYDFPIRF